MLKRGNCLEDGNRPVMGHFSDPDTIFIFF